MAEMRLGAVEMGEGGNAPVIFLHGFGITGAAWGGVQRAIAETHHTLAFDLPGHGASLAYPDATSAGRFAKAVSAELDARGIGRAHLVGHSMGGATAALVALGAAERIASLTLIAPGGFGPEINLRLIARYGAAREREDLLASLEMMFGWRRAVPDALLSMLVGMRAKPGQTEALGVIAGRMTRDGHQGVIPGEGLAGLSMPVKVLWGTEDCVMPASHAKDLPGHFAVHLFTDAGHMLVDELAEPVAGLIRENIR